MMISAIIASKEQAIMGRNRFTRLIYLATLVAMLVAVGLGWQRTDTFERERAAAAEHDKEIWLNQGTKNPHSAAHFSRYAFKPIPTLSTFEPGVTDYTGLAVWMEAHRRNPAAFRYAEGSGDLAKFITLNPAWIMQVVLPLIIILLLFSSYAGEREDGTLRQLLSHGVSLNAIFQGKMKAALLIVLKLLVPLVAIIVIATFIFDTGAEQSDLWLRLIALITAYSLYLIIFSLIAIGVSARSSSRRSAAISLFTLWFLMIIVAPRFASDVATFSTPQPDGYQINQELRKAGGAYWGDTEYQEKTKQALLDKHGVTDVKDLPINYEAYALQLSEEHADPLFDKVYAGLSATHSRQDTVINILSTLSPATAIKQLSAGLAGTDRLHHEAFAWEAELHRRHIIKQMNDDMMYNGVEAGYAYTTDEALWREIADFDGQPPLLTSVFSQYFLMIGVLILWAVMAYLFARQSTLRIADLEAVK